MRSTLLKSVIPAIVFALLSFAARAETMDEEIDYLLDTVATSDCVFIRNGKEHSPDDARSHLELKRKRGKRYFDTTEEFIARIASKSSWSGRPYRIRCGDDAGQPAFDWFMAVLNEMRAAVEQ